MQCAFLPPSTYLTVNVFLATKYFSTYEAKPFRPCLDTDRGFTFASFAPEGATRKHGGRSCSVRKSIIFPARAIYGQNTVKSPFWLQH